MNNAFAVAAADGRGARPWSTANRQTPSTSERILEFLAVTSLILRGTLAEESEQEI